MVHPGDIVFGDADGVLVMPPDDFDEALTKAETSAASEVGLREHFKNGGFAKINIDRLWETDVLGMINDLKKF